MSKHRLRLNGKEVTSEEFHKDGPIGGVGIPACTATYTAADPLISESLGRFPGQVDEYREAIKDARIVGADVLDDGRVSFTSKRARDELMDMNEVVDLG